MDQRIEHTVIMHPETLCLTLLLKNLLVKAAGELGSSQHELLVLLAWPATKAVLSLMQPVPVDWFHCVLGE